MMSREIGSNPYPGLRPFETEEDYLFFGRDGQSEEILASLRRERFVAVVGVSGSGKSSLIRAGLLPYLYGGFMSGASSHWRVALMRPGGDPIRNLTQALYQSSVLMPPNLSAQDAAEQEILLEVTLRRSGLGLIEAVRQAHLPPVDNLLVVVDQFEELFRFAEPSRAARTDEDAAAFVKLLIESTAQRDLPIYVVLTMRSDFIGECASYRDLPEAVATGLYLIPRMTRDNRREAIEHPALVAGARIAPRLMNRLLNEGGNNPDQLPILQHALMRTWDFWCHHRDRETPIDLEDYKAIGEMSEALSIHAEEAYAELPDERAREIAKRMFQALTEKGEDNREIRRPTSVGTIAAIAGASVEEVIAVIEHFRRAGRSFLMPPPGVSLTGDSVIDISHESLIRGWHRLNKWVDEEAQSAQVYIRLAETAALHAQGHAGLWDNEDLAYALAWREKEKPNAEWGKHYREGYEAAMSFLDNSAAAHRAALEEKRREKQAARIRAVAVVASAIVIVSIMGLGWFRSYENRKTSDALAQVRMESDRKLRDAEFQAQLQQQRAEAKLQMELQKAAEDKEAAVRIAEMQAKSEQAQQEAEWVRNVSRAGDGQRIETAAETRNLTTTVQPMLPPSQQIDIYETRGSMLGKMGDHQRSVEAYTSALAMQPNDVELKEHRGYEYILMGRPDDALRDFNSYLETDPHSSTTRLNIVVALAMMKRYHEASVELERALADYQIESGSMYDSEISPDIQRATGQTILSSDYPKSRIAMFYEAATLRAFSGEPGFEQALARADLMARKDGFYSSAAAPGVPASGSIDPFLIAIEWAWLSARAQAIASGAQSGEDYGVYAAYGAIWERAASIQPRFMDWAGHFYIAFHDTYKAHPQRRYDRLNSFVNQRLHALYPGSGQPAKVLDTAALDAGTLADRASALDDRGDYAGEISALTDAIKSIEHRPEDRAELIVLLMRRAFAYRSNKEYSKATKDAARVLALEPHSAEAYICLGDAETDPAKRQKDYELAVQYGPNVWYAKTRLADEIQDKDPARALKLLQDADRIIPPNSWIYSRMAAIQNRQGDFQAALRSANSAIAAEPYNADLYELRDQALKGLSISDTERAIDRASEYRKLADHLARTGQPERALSLYLSSLRTLAGIRTSDADADNLRAEETVTAHDVTDMLERLGSRRSAVTFWTNTRSDGYLQPISDVAQREIQRLSAAQ